MVSGFEPDKLRHLVLTLAVAALAGCGDTVKIIECPPGTRPDGSRCVPNDAPDTSPDPDTSTTTTTDTETTTTTATDTATSPLDTDLDSSSSADTAQPRPTGADCLKNADCAS